ncbi:MAG: type II toxin-antitoxin system VapC family toxin [Myxococcaceae bacterium]
MRLLLDTHVLLWCLAEPSKLSAAARSKIESPDSTVFVSVASAWEMEIKRAIGKLESPDDLEAQLRARRFTELPLYVRHVMGLRLIPALHKDPFDRILIAQAKQDDLTLVTRDPHVIAYPVETLLA